MYERFTDRARKVMALSNQEAQRFNHEYIGTEHILLGLIKEGSGVAATIMKNLDISLSKARLEVEKLVKASPDMVLMGKLPQTPRAKKVIEYAIEEARNLGHNYVGTEHLLLGLIRERDGVGAQVLESFGAKTDVIREHILAIVGKETQEKEPSSANVHAEWPGATVYTCTLGELKEVLTTDKAFQRAERSVRELIGKLTFVATSTELSDLSGILVKLSEIQNKYKKNEQIVK